MLLPNEMQSWYTVASIAWLVTFALQVWRQMPRMTSYMKDDIDISVPIKVGASQIFTRVGE